MKKNQDDFLNLTSNVGNESVLNEDEYFSDKQQVILNQEVLLDESKMMHSHYDESSVNFTPIDTQSKKKASNTKSDLYSRKNKENTICEQAQMLLQLFLQHQVKDLEIKPTVYQIFSVDEALLLKCGFSDDTFKQVVEQLLKFARDISENEKIEKFIELVPVQSSREVFFEICYKVFEDDHVNWGRIVTLFYFGSRLIIRSLKQKIDSVPWAKDMLIWIVEFFKLRFLNWILIQGGWATILKWAKFSEDMWKVLFFGSIIFGLWAYFRKN